MKQTILGLITLATISLGFATTTNAQDNDRESRRAEMQARQTERLVKELDLDDTQKAKFTESYGRYLKELEALRPQRNDADGQTGASTQQEPKAKKDKDSKDDKDSKRDKKDKKELTDEEATTQLQAYFDLQAEQIQRQQQHLDIQKKYCAEMSAFLTPQQLLKVFRQPQQNQRRQQYGRQGRQGGRGGFGGGFGGGPRGGGPRDGGFGGPGGDF